MKRHRPALRLSVRLTARQRATVLAIARRTRRSQAAVVADAMNLSGALGPSLRGLLATLPTKRRTLTR